MTRSKSRINDATYFNEHDLLAKSAPLATPEKEQMLSDNRSVEQSYCHDQSDCNQIRNFEDAEMDSSSSISADDSIPEVLTSSQLQKLRILSVDKVFWSKRHGGRVLAKVTTTDATKQFSRVKLM